MEAYNQYRSAMTNEDESIYSLEGFARSNIYNNPAKVNNKTNINENKLSQRKNQCMCKYSFLLKIEQRN